MSANLLRNFCLFLCLCVSTSSLVLANDADPYIGDQTLPAWVKPVAIPQEYVVPEHQIKEGTYYLLVDHQTQIGNNNNVSRYNRFVTEIINQKGIEHNAQIEIGFDPLYQTVLLHQLNIIRDGRVINRLDETAFSLLHDETDLGSQLYHGKRTLHGIIPDLRNGDIVDYSYSIIGSNPVFDGAFAMQRSLQWSIPVEALNIRFVTPKGYQLQGDFLKTEGVLEKNETAESTEYLYSSTRLAALSIDDNYPYWYTAYPNLFVSSQHSWQEVVDWGIGLFSPSFNDDQRLQDVLKDIKSQNVALPEQVSAAVQFVQNEIRYYGIELGENSHRPSPATDTLNRRFGDCKDKTVLLIQLLRGLGVEAHPVLVDSYGMDELVNIVPSGHWFNHVIVKAILNGDEFWIDPTREMQFGPLAEIQQRDYGYGLVLAPGVSALEKMDVTETETFIVVDYYDLSEGALGNVKFKTENTYTGAAADHQRNRIADIGISGVQSSYLEHYQNYYPSVRNAGDMQFKDDKGSNEVFLVQDYQITDFWQEDEEEYNAYFYSEAINYALNDPEDVDRQHPLALEFPLNISQQINIQLHDIDWSFDDENNEINNDYFTFKQSTLFDKSQNHLQLNYSLVHHKDHVPVADFDEYLKALKAAREIKNYSIVEYKDTEDTVAQDTAEEPADTEEVHIWQELKVFLYVAIAYLVALVVYLFWRSQDNKQQKQDAEPLYYPVRPLKLIIFGVLTLGVYYTYWFYKNFRYEKEHNSEAIMPVWRAIFYVFFYYSLFARIVQRTTKINNQEAEQPATSESEVKVPGYAIAFAITLLLANLISLYWDVSLTLLNVMTAVLLLPINNRVVNVNKGNRAAELNSKLRPRHVLLLLMVLPLNAYFLAYDFNLMPATKVVSGDALYRHDVNFMVQNNIVEEGESITWFYSGAMFSFSDDGNGVTEQSVFSYWTEDDKLFVENAKYADIADINVEWTNEIFSDTTINITRENGEGFLLFVSNEADGDEKFVNYLMQQWKQAK